MAATPILAQGVTVSIDNSGGTPVTINGVISLTGIGSGSATEIDVTTLASTAKEFRQGLRDFGSISMELIRNQDDLGQKEMFDAMGLQAVREFIVTLPTSTANVGTFDGFVQSISTDINADGVVTGTATVRITGAVAWT
jgi:hypothetical protein